MVYEDEDFEDLDLEELLAVIQDEKLAVLPKMPKAAEREEVGVLVSWVLMHELNLG